MTTVPIIHANGADIPQVGFDSMRLTGDIGAKATHDAIEVGHRHIDTATNYGNEADLDVVPPKRPRGQSAARTSVGLKRKRLGSNLRFCHRGVYFVISRLLKMGQRSTQVIHPNLKRPIYDRSRVAS